MNTKRKILIIEIFLLFTGIPLILLLYQTALLKILILAAGTIISLVYVLNKGYKLKLCFKIEKHLFRPEYVVRITIVCLLIMLLGFIFRREFFLKLPYAPVFIPLLVIGYPLISVIPQEIIYRLFFFERYGILFGSNLSAVLCNAILFALLHIIYGNAAAVIFTFFGGILFAVTYLKTKSLVMTVIEHALYGYCIFLAGYGQYFLSENIFRLLFQMHLNK